jgi:transposase
MIGSKDFSQPIFVSASLHDIVPEEHFLRQVDRFIDFSFIREKVRHLYSHTGQPSIDPIVLVKILLIGYFYNIASERKLVQEIQVNLAYRLFIGYNLNEDIPDHSTLSKGRYRFGEAIFKEIFEHIVKQAIELGLVEGEHLSFDSTLVKANASLSSLEKVKPKWAPFDFFRQLEEENPSQESYATKTNKDKAPKNKEYVSKTDPDASLIKRAKKGTFLAYKAHMGIDAKNRIITTCLATSGKVADGAVLTGMLTSEFFSLKFKPNEVSADKAYGTIPILKDLDALGIKAYIPLSNSFDQGNRESFNYDSKRDVIICPQGKALRFQRNNASKNKLIYNADKKDCNACPKRCTTSKNGRSFELSYDWPLIEAAKQRAGSLKGKRAKVIRQTVTEPIFSEAKGFHCMGRAMFRGQKNMQIQLFLTSTALNIKRIVKLTGEPHRKAISEAKSTLLSFTKRLLLQYCLEFS